MSRWYRLEGKTPVKTDEWTGVGLLHDAASRTVAREEVRPGVEVSTVFLVLDHGWDDRGPLLFETMIFGGPLDQEQDRYRTWEEAEAGHAAMVRRARLA